MQSRQCQLPSLQRAHANDLNEISNLIVHCVREVNAKDYPPHVIDAVTEKYSSNHLSELFKDKYVLVQRTNGKIVGVGAFGTGEVTSLFVDPSHHGSGIGQRILHALEKEAARQGFTSVELHSSVTAVHFYEKRGYVHLKHLEEGLYGECFRMCKTIDSCDLTTGSISDNYLPRRSPMQRDRLEKGVAQH